jgi:hypothetical protein
MNYRTQYQHPNQSGYPNAGFHHCPGSEGVFDAEIKIFLYQPESPVIDMCGHQTSGSDGKNHQLGAHTSAVNQWQYNPGCCYTGNRG